MGGWGWGWVEERWLRDFPKGQVGNGSFHSKLGETTVFTEGECANLLYKGDLLGSVYFLRGRNGRVYLLGEGDNTMDAWDLVLAKPVFSWEEWTTPFEDDGLHWKNLTIFNADRWY